MTDKGIVGREAAARAARRRAKARACRTRSGVAARALLRDRAAGRPALQEGQARSLPALDTDPVTV